MTERLRQLMHDETDTLDIPPPPAGAVLTTGRKLRRRRRATTALVGVAGAALIGGTAFGASALFGDSSSGTDRSVVAEATTAPTVYAVGGTVVVDDRPVPVPGTVHDMVHVSTGVLVRSNANGGASDGSGPETLTHISPEGEATEIATIPEGVGPATDVDQSLYALAEQSGDGFVAVLREASTGEEVARVDLPDQPKSYWDVPPLSLDGDTVYVGYKSSTWAVDWRTGDATEVAGSEGGLEEIQGGRLARGYGERVEIVDLSSGDVLLEQDLSGYGWGTLSPDGEYVVFTVEEDFDTETGEVTPVPSTLVQIDSGESLELPLSQSGYGWGFTASGAAVNVGEQEVTVCTVADGCESTPRPEGLTGEAKPAGQRFES